MNDMILILNYSDTFSREIALRLRGEQVYGRIVSGMTTSAQIADLQPRGIILSGAAANAPGVFDAGILDLGIPVLALGHASHMLLAAQGGASAGIALTDKKASVRYEDSPLFTDLTGGERYMKELMTLMLPTDVQMIASAAGCTVAFENRAKKQYGVQFELERNDPEGSTILKNFARDICGCEAWWTEEAYLREARAHLESAAAQGGFALCAVSGGVDSTVAAVLTHQAFGNRMRALYVDNGMMREGESGQIQATFEALGIPLITVDRAAETLGALAGKRTMEEKRQVSVALLHDAVKREAAVHSGVVTLVLGTNYSDLCGGLREVWRESGLNVVEPLQDLFKGEVRTLARQIGLSEEIAGRKPFPALGLGARVIGEVTQKRLDALRIAEAIFSEEIEAAGLGRKLYKYFPILAGEELVSGKEMLVLRAVNASGGMLVPARLPYDLVERTVERILSGAPLIGRVFYDQTPTPVGTETFG